MVTVHPPDLVPDCEGYHNLEKPDNALAMRRIGTTSRLRVPPLSAPYLDRRNLQREWKWQIEFNYGSQVAFKAWVFDSRPRTSRVRSD